MSSRPDLSSHKDHKARFPPGDFFRANRLSIVKIEQISDQLQSRAHKTKEKVASREKSRLVENGLKGRFLSLEGWHASMQNSPGLVQSLVAAVQASVQTALKALCWGINISSHHFTVKSTKYNLKNLTRIIRILYNR